MLKQVNMRSVIEGILAIPATVVFGGLAVIGLPIAAFVSVLSAASYESAGLMVLGMLVLFAAGALAGLGALWASILGWPRLSARVLTVGLMVGLAAAGLFVLMTLSNDRFDVATTMSHNAPLLTPLLLVLPVGVSRLIATIRERRTVS